MNSVTVFMAELPSGEGPVGKMAWAQFLYLCNNTMCRHPFKQTMANKDNLCHMSGVHDPALRRSRAILFAGEPPGPSAGFNLPSTTNHPTPDVLWLTGTAVPPSTWRQRAVGHYSYHNYRFRRGVP